MIVHSSLFAHVSRSRRGGALARVVGFRPRNLGFWVRRMSLEDQTKRFQATRRGLGRYTFRVSGLVFRFSMFGYRVSVFGFRVSVVGFQVSVFGFRVSGFGGVRVRGVGAGLFDARGLRDRVAVPATS